MKDPNFCNLLSAQTRYSFYEIWQTVKAGEELQGEEKTIGELMQQHPEYHETWEHAAELADYEYGRETEVNPFMHIAIDSIVVNQISQRTPPEVPEAYERLRKRGLAHLNTIHEIDRVFVQQLWRIMKEQVPFDTKRYASDVGRL